MSAASKTRSLKIPKKYKIKNTIHVMLTLAQMTQKDFLILVFKRTNKKKEYCYTSKNKKNRIHKKISIVNATIKSRMKVIIIP